MHSRDHLPPPDLWPTILRTTPELQYPLRLNLATVLLDEHLERGAGKVEAALTEHAAVLEAAVVPLLTRYAGRYRRRSSC